MRLERRKSKLGDSEPQPPKALSQEKSLRDFLSTESGTNKHQLKVRAKQSLSLVRITFYWETKAS